MPDVLMGVHAAACLVTRGGGGGGGGQSGGAPRTTELSRQNARSPRHLGLHRGERERRALAAGAKRFSKARSTSTSKAGWAAMVFFLARAFCQASHHVPLWLLVTLKLRNRLMKMDFSRRLQHAPLVHGAQQRV